jgi:hypothetical protein
MVFLVASFVSVFPEKRLELKSIGADEDRGAAATVAAAPQFSFAPKGSLVRAVS